MDKYIGDKFEALPINSWAKGDDRYLRLAKLDAILDGEFYDGLSYPFYQETTGGEGTGGTYIPIRDRRPSFRFNLANMVADQVGRKLFGGPHAPALVNPSEKVRQKIDAIKEECDLESKMIEAIHWGSVGSAATIFQIVPFEFKGTKKSKVVAKNVRARFCTPTFNKLDELSRLMIHYPVQGSDFLFADTAIDEDFENEPIKGDQTYWYVMELTSQMEITFKPIPLFKWKPADGKNGKLIKHEEISHELGFVPAHWHQYRTGKHRPYDGRCYWEPAIPNLIDLDFSISQIGGGIRYNAVPQVIVKGEVVNSSADGGLGRGASRFLQVKADEKEGDHEEKDSKVYMLEATGNGMAVGLEHWAPLVLRIAMQQICASLKDPNKVTTAMSGKGMEVLESEFLDLAKELRTVFGDKGYLKLLKKIAVACSMKHHAVMEGVSPEEIDALTLTWPPLSSIGMMEFQAMCMGLQSLVEAAIMDKEQAKDYALGQIDLPVVSANKNYLPSIATKEEPEPLAAKQTDDDDTSGQLNALVASAIQKATQEPLNTQFKMQGA